MNISLMALLICDCLLTIVWEILICTSVDVDDLVGIYILKPLFSCKYRRPAAASEKEDILDAHQRTGTFYRGLQISTVE